MSLHGTRRAGSALFTLTRLRPLKRLWPPKLREFAMLGWAVTFLIIALIAAVLGFGGIAGFAVELAKIVFIVALILFVVSAVFGFMRGRSPTIP